MGEVCVIYLCVCLVYVWCMYVCGLCNGVCVCCGIFSLCCECWGIICVMFECCRFNMFVPYMLVCAGSGSKFISFNNHSEGK